MQELILYIKPKVVAANQTTQKFERVDLMEAELITLTQVIQDVKEIDKIFTDFSRTFNLPASKVNNKIFQHWYNDDVIGFDNHIMSDAIIELNHLPFKIGQIKLESVVMKNNKPSMYKVTFFGSTTTLNSLIGEDKLSDLSWIDNFNTLNTNTKTGLETGLDFTFDSTTYNKAIIFPLLTHTQKYILNITGEFDNVGNIAFNGSSVANYNRRGVLPEDLKPAIKVSLILKAIEQQYGLTFKSGEFLDSSAITNLYMWLHRDKGKMLLAGTWLGDSDSYTCSDVSTNGCSFFTGTNNYFDTTTGIIKYLNWSLINPNSFSGISGSISFQVTPQSGYTNVIYSLSFLNYSTMETIAIIENVVGTQTIVLNLDGLNGLTTTEKSNFFITKVVSESGFQFQSQIQYNKQYITTSSTGTQTTFNETALFTSTSSTLSPTSGLIIMSEQIPKMKVIDFLTSLFKMHNLTAFVNDNNEIVVKTLDSFYSGGDTIDISKHVVTDKKLIESTLPFSEVDFKYSEPKTILAKEFLNLNNREFGSLDYVSNDSKSKKYEIKIPFEHMMFERLRFSQNSSTTFANQLTNVQYGLFVDENLNPTIGAPLLFYGQFCDFDEDTHGGVDRINFVDSVRPSDGSMPAAGTRSSIGSAWLPSNTFSSTGIHPLFNKPDFETHFGNEINSFTLTNYSGLTNSLFELYYKNYILKGFNKKTRLYKLKAILPLKELIKISLDDKIIVGTREFTINKMTTKLQSGETELELLSEPE